MRFDERKTAEYLAKSEADRLAKIERMERLRKQIREYAPDLADTINLLRDVFREKDGSLGKISIGHVEFLKNGVKE